MTRLDQEEWFTLDDIEVSENTETLYCISVDSPEKQFLIGKNIRIPTHNSEEAKAEDELKGEAAMIIGSIARLGRAAGVHLVIATQRPDAKIISGETKANLGVRINCGRTDSNASSMILGTGDGARVKSNPRGRLFLRIFGTGNHGQGFYADQSWIDEWLSNQGLNQDGSPIGGKKSRLANVVDMNQFAESDLDTREGVDNESAIESIRDEESNDDFESIMQDDDDDDFTYDDDDDETDAKPDNVDRPQLKGTDTSMDKFARAEDSWDDELESILEDNNS